MRNGVEGEEIGYWQFASKPKMRRHKISWSVLRPLSVWPACFLQLKLGQPDLAMYYKFRLAKPYDPTYPAKTTKSPALRLSLDSDTTLIR